jgi:hypothetical protein
VSVHRSRRVRNTYNISLLRKRIADALPRPLSPIGEAAVEGFLSLAGVSRWLPERIGLLQLSHVFDIGLPFALIGDNPTVKPLALGVGDAVCEGKLPHPDLWRAVHAGALLTHWGGSVQFVTDTGAAASRLEVALPDGQTPRVDVVGWQPALGTEPVTDLADDRPRILAIDVRGSGSCHEAITAACADDFDRTPEMLAVLSFEPRFWVSVEHKEWIHLARINANAQVPVASDTLGAGDGGRHTLSFALLGAA